MVIFLARQHALHLTRLELGRVARVGFQNESHLELPRSQQRCLK